MNADVNLLLADKYITEYANDDEMAKLPVFSMYEMQGMVPPDMDGNFIHYTHDMTNALNTVEQRMNGNEANRNEKKQLKSTIDNYNAKVKEPLRKLVEETLPAQFTLKNANVNENDVMKTVTAEDVKELYSAYDALYQGIESFKADYSKVKNHTAEEKELFDMMQGVYEKVDNKRKLLGYLADEKGNSLNADIDAFNKLPDEQRKNNEKAKLFAYAMGCKEHLRLGTLLPQYLLDDHNAPRVGNMLSMMNKKKDIDAANEVVEKASKIEWENGKRSLDSIKDIDLYKKQIGSGHHVYQFATNNDHENFKKVFETTLKTMPESLKNIEAENKNGQKVNINLETVLREQLDKFLFKKGKNGEKVPADLTHTFCWHNALLSNDDGFGGIKTNYNNFGEAEEEVNIFIERLNKNEYNAGFAYNGFDRKEPVGYNQGVALAFAAETAPTGLVPDAKLLDKTTLPLAGGKTKPDQTADVTLVRVEPRYNKNPEFGEENPLFGNPPFYTTPANFRSCVYVGDLPQGLILELEPHYYKGLSAQQMEQKTQQLLANAEKKGLKVGEKYGRSPLTSSVRDYAEFNKPKLISDTANLQVLDYLWGIPTRSTDNMRMEFQMGKDLKGDPKPKLTGMGGAMDNVKPFMIHADDIEGSKKLTNPENMLIITDQMASNVRRWTKKQFTTEEKMLFKKLPKQAQEDFDLRCNSIMLMLEKSKDHEFPDIKNSKGEIEKGGLVTEKGYLRVVSSKELEKINMDSLSLGRNAVSFRERDNVKPVNLFDTLATMPKACHEAMHDKYIAHWTDNKSPIKGDGISAEEAAIVDYSDYDKAFNLIEAERLTVKTPSLMHDVVKMNNDRKKEYGWHKYISGDSKEYTNVINSVAELTNKANYFKALVNLEYDFVKDPATVTQRYPQLAEEIKEARKQRLEFEKKLAKEKGMEPPRSLPPVDKDPLVFHQVQEARNKAREDIEKYLLTNDNYRSDFGKQRRRSMVELYNKINHQMEEHAYFTGDTTYVPKKCIMDPETLKIKFENYYPDRRTFEVQGVHQTLSKEYLNAENKVDAKDRKKLSDINTRKKLNALNNPEFVELSIKVSENRATDEEKAKFDKFVAKSRRDTFEMFTESEIREVKSQYGDPNTKKGRKVKPTFEKPEQPAQPKPKPKAKGKAPM